MKKKRINTLISLVAVISVFQATMTFGNKSDDNKNEVSSVSILVNNIVSSMPDELVSIKQIDDGTVFINFKNSSSKINIKGNIAYVKTTYSDGFYEKDFFDINDFIITERHVVSYKGNNQSNISNVEKEETIKSAFKITQEELDFVLAGPMAEGIEDNYIDVSAAMRTGINRFFSFAWVNHAAQNLELNFDEVTIYDIFRDPYQFSVYYPVNDVSRYERFVGIKSGEGYQGALDTLYYSIFEDEIPEELVSKIVVHDYLEFQDKNDPIPGSYSYEQFTEGGNKHYRHQKDNDRIFISDTVLSEYIVNNNLRLKIK